MKIIEKRWEIWVPADIDTVWAFFTRPENLNRLTPPDMDFEILSDIAGRDMYPGMIVRYRVRPILGIPLNWVTEITQVREKQFFIDEQRFGPYAFWHHEHHFEERDGGVLMTDHLHYGIPFGPIGGLANRLFVERKVDEIFAYRERVVLDIFPEGK
jgi:ligand-binding SRPBCC domain-containing protein